MHITVSWIKILNAGNELSLCFIAIDRVVMKLYANIDNNITKYVYNK